MYDVTNNHKSYLKMVHPKVLKVQNVNVCLFFRLHYFTYTTTYNPFFLNLGKGIWVWVISRVISNSIIKQVLSL